MNTTNAILQKLRLTYLQELPARLDAIEKLIMDLEQVGLDGAVFDELFRLVHSLKGSGGTYGMYVITQICHPLEDLLSTLPEKPKRLQTDFVDLGLAYVDLLRLAVEQLEDPFNHKLNVEAALADLYRRAHADTYSVLIVEKSGLMISFLKERLRTLNFRIEVEEDGYVALGRALNEPFQILITGLELPRLNGLALISALRLAQTHHETQTILLTTKLKPPAEQHAPHHIILKGAHLQDQLQLTLEKLRSSL